MTTDELIHLLRRWLEETEEMPVTDAELWLRASLGTLLLRYRHHVRFGHPGPERWCTLCGKPVNQCYC
jgi:hypothetical protein